ncbi:type IV pilin [Natronorubrum texcoconense]|uniref:Flagellin N-terminal-like domain-containing protein n=1 Tax=Natronorubrum texcoconense TaxID=1095776 RepID=A0A1G8VGU1_9EURY|nr:type IV pilin N-terminal domain-containing protein [Natronorubrum texcoconense]SDJ65124.1 flagellin N-terminal-like domain-containing protein [Natronorubrum texcoconense]
MDLTKYRNKLIGNEDERAVSPVIGVILMVAITVILAAVIAAFVLDMGDMGDSAPNANFNYDTDSDGYIVAVEHTSGDSVDYNTLTVIVDGTSYESEDLDGGDWDGNEEISAGNTLEIDGDLDGSETDVEEVTITWESDGSSSTLAEFEV